MARDIPSIYAWLTGGSASVDSGGGSGADLTFPDISGVGSGITLATTSPPATIRQAGRYLVIATVQYSAPGANDGNLTANFLAVLKQNGVAQSTAYGHAHVIHNSVPDGWEVTIGGTSYALPGQSAANGQVTVAAILPCDVGDTLSVTCQGTEYGGNFTGDLSIYMLP